MNDNQIAALLRLREATKPLKIHASTRKVLKEAGYVTEGANGYCVISEEGTAFLEARERAEEIAATEAKIWGDRQMAELHRHCQGWLDVHARLTFGAKRYADYVLAALLTESPILPSGNKWKEGGDEKVRAWAELALDAVRELRVRQAESEEDGVDLSVVYEIGPSVEQRAAERRAAAVERAADPEEGNVVSIDRYLKERSA